MICSGPIGTHQRTFSVIKSFVTNNFTGLYCTAFTGGFSNVNIIWHAETVFITTAINTLADSTNTQSISMGSGGLSFDTPNQMVFCNNANIYGTAPVGEMDFDSLTRKDYVDVAVLSSVT